MILSLGYNILYKGSNYLIVFYKNVHSLLIKFFYTDVEGKCNKNSCF